MSGSKRIVCLANSHKLAGRCVAGGEWAPGKGGGDWISLVGPREGGDVSEYERRYEDGSDPRVLDIIDITVKRRQPCGWQNENWLLEPEYYWEKTGLYSPFDLQTLADPVEPLWADGNSTYHGCNDRIPFELERKASSSLRWIRVEELVLEVFVPGEVFETAKRRVQGRFVHAGQDYALWVTDPSYERRYLAKLNGVYRIGECYLTISLGEPYGGAIYKFIAAIVEPGYWQVFER